MKNFLVIFIVLIAMLAAEFFWIGNMHTKHKLFPEIATRTQINAAYADLLHKIYKDNPEYWNNDIMNCREYKQLDSLKEGDWEDFYLY